jgi:hypothetical protein
MLSSRTTSYSLPRLTHAWRWSFLGTIRHFGAHDMMKLWGFPRCDTLTLAPAVHTHTQPGTLTLGAFSRGRHSGIGSAITVIWNSDASSHRAPMPGYPFRFALGLRLV